MIDERRSRGRRRRRRELPGDREVRPPARAQRRRARPPSSRSWRAAASTAPSASCPTRAARRYQPALRRRHRRVPASRRAACARSTCSARTSTPIADRTTTAISSISPNCCISWPRFDGIDRIRYTTSHPVEFSDALIEAYAEVPELVEPPAPAGAERLRSHPRSDEARPHGARVQVAQDPPAAAHRARISACPRISSSASPARPRPILRRR
jgi:hypothetical protein